MRLASALRLLTCALFLCSGSRTPARAHAQDTQDRSDAQAQQVSIARSALWVSASATFLSAALGGYYALDVENIYDRSRALPSVSPEQGTLRREARNTAYVADGFFLATVVFAAASVVLLVVAPGSARKADKTVHSEQGRLVWRGDFL